MAGAELDALLRRGRPARGHQREASAELLAEAEQQRGRGDDRVARLRNASLAGEFLEIGEAFGRPAGAPHLEPIGEEAQRDAARTAQIAVHEGVDHELAQHELRVVAGVVRAEAALPPREAEGAIEERREPTFEVRACDHGVEQAPAGRGHAHDAPLGKSDLGHAPEQVETRERRRDPGRRTSEETEAHGRVVTADARHERRMALAEEAIERAEVEIVQIRHTHGQSFVRHAAP